MFNQVHHLTSYSHFNGYSFRLTPLGWRCTPLRASPSRMVLSFSKLLVVADFLLSLPIGDLRAKIRNALTINNAREEESV